MLRIFTSLTLILMTALAIPAHAASAAELYTANLGNHSVTVHSISDNGDQAPLRNIQGAATGLNWPNGVAVFNGEVFVANHWGHSVTVYNDTDNGNAAPKRTLGGSSTGIANPTQLVIDGNELYVANYGSNIKVFNLTGTGNIAPKRAITTLSSI